MTLGKSKGIVDDRRDVKEREKRWGKGKRYQFHILQSRDGEIMSIQIFMYVFYSYNDNLVELF